MKSGKDGVLRILKRLGVFAACRALFRRKVRILAYHGISRADEHEFQPWLFMREAVFRRQLDMIVALGLPVLPVSELAEALDGRRALDGGVVITIDDGWYGTFRDAVPALVARGFPATVYVTTYYVEQGLPVFNLLISYLFWRTTRATLDLAALGCGLSGRFDLTRAAEREQAVELLRAQDAHLGAQQRQALARTLGVALGLDVDALLADRRLGLMTPAEVAELAAMAGMDVELHTHRHRMGGMTREEMTREIGDNRRSLTAMTGAQCAHFCYPSGNCDPRVWPILAELGVRTATTTVPGLVDAQSPRYDLARTCISDQMSDIAFEAELSGVNEALRRVRAWLGGAARRA